MAVAAAIACGSAHASTINFNNPNADYAPDANISIASGNSSITAKDVNMAGKSLKTNLNQYGETGNGSLSIKAGNANLDYYGQTINIGSRGSSASFSGEFDLTGNLAITNGGIHLRLDKEASNPARAENKLMINAASITLTGDGSLGNGYEAGAGLVLRNGPEGNPRTIPGGLVDVRATADKIKIEGMGYWGIYLDGNYTNATNDTGTRLTLEANQIDLSGGWTATDAESVAIRVDQGAELNLFGRGERQQLTITTKHIDSPLAENSTFQDVAIYNVGGKVLAQYGEGSHLKLIGGIVSWGSPRDNFSTSTTIEPSSGSLIEVDGGLGALYATLTITNQGSHRIEAPSILAMGGQLKLDLETGSAETDTGILKGAAESYYGATLDIHLAGLKNEFTGTTLIVEWEGYQPTGILNLNLEKGAAWNVGVEDDTDDGSNTLTSLSLSKGILNLAHRNGTEDTTYRTVRADTLKGDGGTINFNLVLNSNEEENDRLLLKTFESGDHTVHVEAHSGFELVDMQGYLIRADEWQGGTFTADTNKLETGVYLYNYTVEYRQNEEEGTTDWYLSFDKYTPPAPEPDDPNPGPKPEPTPQPPLSPSGEAVASLAGMGAQTAMYLAQLSDVRKRLGEVRRGAVEGLWASVGGSGDHISGFRGTGFKQDAYRFNFGFDRKAGEWLLGGTLKAMTADQKTRGTQFQGKGDAHSEGFNLYATWTDGNGSYADFVAGLDRYHEKLSTHMLNGLGVSGAYRNIGLGLSAEVGHQFMSKDAWFIEPQAQLSYYRLWGDDFALSNGMKVSQKNFNGLTGRLGLASGKEFKKADGTEAGQLYTRLGVKHELMGDQEIHVNGIRFKDGLLGTRFYYGLGAEWLLAKNVKVFGHVERENGSRYTREFDFNLGVKYAF